MYDFEEKAWNLRRYGDGNELLLRMSDAEVRKKLLERD